MRLGGSSLELRARVEQNLGIVANIQGDIDDALACYTRSLEAYNRCGDEHGCAIAYHNLGMVSAQRRLLADADRYFTKSYEIAARTGDTYLEGLCLLNYADVYFQRERYEEARQNAEAALALLGNIGGDVVKAQAYRVLGMVHRETGEPDLAESRLRSAVALAVGAGSVLNEAAACRELAVLYQAQGRNQDALALLNQAHALFSRLDARADLVNVDAKMAELETTYLAVVSEWGKSIESTDTYTFGHCERVANHAVAVARALGLDEREQTAIRVGAYLHDLGKVRIPQDILSKPGPLTPDEFAVVQMHPTWGIELLAEIQFPWEIKPIIRWHHERYDGTGYPDQLRGDAIPVAAQVVGIVDVYDALVTTRPYHPALAPAEALAEIGRYREWWSEAVYEDARGPLLLSRIEPDAALLERMRRGLPDAHVLPIGTSAHVGGTSACEVEAMEGFAVLRACALAGVPAVELRAVSNAIDEPDRAKWRFDDALAALADALDRLDVV